jgi:uncharacterized Tic20 family protein
MNGGYRSTEGERTLAAACHMSILPTFFLGPLVIWLVKRDESPLIDKNGREALNFCIALSAYAFVCFLLAFAVGPLPFVPLFLFAAAVVVIATVRIHGGASYRYPFIFRLISK